MRDENEPVGSVTEEAVKLLGALQGWAKENAQDASSVAGASSMFAAFNEHIATGGEECRYCPVCQLISMAREVSPEAKHHLSSAAIALFKALSAAASASAGQGARRPCDPMEKIDVTEDAWDE